MTIQELFIRSNQELLKVVTAIRDDQWELMLPDKAAFRPTNVLDAVRYHIFDDAWVPDVLAGKTAEEVGDVYDVLKSLPSIEVPAEYVQYNERANDAVRGFSDLERATHLSYGQFSASEYLQHITSFRALRAYDIGKLLGVGTVMADDYVQALSDEYTPHIELYRQMGVFPPAVDVSADADAQTKLLAMFGRDAV